MAPESRPKIIRATERDVGEIADLAGVIWRVHYPGIITSEQIDYMLAKMYSLEVLRDEIARRGICYEKLMVDGEFAGFASFGPVAAEADEAGATEEGASGFKTVKLHKLYVLPRWHGKGLGTLLLKHCEDEARKGGARKIILAVNKRNSKAIAAYQRNGFAAVKSVVVDIGGGFVMDDFVMEKRI
jgi:GNAT superfamily N-acetyltransferase